MKDQRNQKKLFAFLFVVILTGCFLYLGARGTYTSYESEIEGNASASVAGIQLKINGEDVVGNNDGTLDNRIILDNTTWVSTHTREEKISPGSTGTIDLALDPSGSEVAIKYDFRFVDKRIDDDKLLTFGSITSDDTFTRTGVDTYTGIFTLNDIENHKIVHISADFFFDYLTDIEGITEDNQVLDDLFEIHFHAIQYTGEAIEEYTGE